jgi:hypothetical protein
MTKEPSGPIVVVDTKDAASTLTADDAMARYKRIKRRQQVAAAIGIALLILLYVFLRFVLPEFARGPAP